MLFHSLPESSCSYIFMTFFKTDSHFYGHNIKSFIKYIHSWLESLLKNRELLKIKNEKWIVYIFVESKLLFYLLLLLQANNDLNVIPKDYK